MQTRIDTIGVALKQYKRLAYAGRYGGLGGHLHDAEDALASWEHVVDTLQQRRDDKMADLDLDLTVELEGKSVTVGEMLGIDENDLSTEYATQAARFAYVAVLTARAKQVWAEAERTRKEEEAAAFAEYKSDPQWVPEGSKSVTDGYANQLVQVDADCNELRRKENEAEYNYRLLLALSDAFQMRANMLISLGADQRAERSMTDMTTLENPGDAVRHTQRARRAGG